MSEVINVEAVRTVVETASSQQPFAQRAGLGQQFVSEVLRGTRPPSPRLLAALGLVRVTGYAPDPASRARPG
ncbi:hypothetical protein PKCBPO_00873 [Methylorubrum thiocyanatum]